jgi:hypothetical protein
VYSDPSSFVEFICVTLEVSHRVPVSVFFHVCYIQYFEWRSFGPYSSLADSRNGVCLFFIQTVGKLHIANF